MSLSIQKRWEIVFLHHHPKGPKMSIKPLACYMHCSINTIKHWLNTYASTGDVQDLPHSGRPKLTTEKQDDKIEQLALTNDEDTSDQLTTRAKRKGIDVSSRTVRHRLQQRGIAMLPTTSKPLLTEAHREKRMAWAEANVDTDWNKVVFTDETTFKLFQVRKKVWRRKGEVKIRQTVKHPLKVHVWGCFSAKGWGRICTFTKNLNAQLLTKIYQWGLLGTSKKWFGNDTSKWVLQEDNDPKHTSKLAQQWKAQNNVNRMAWPPQSPDLNPIENAWKVLKSNVAHHHPKTKGALVRAIQNEWGRLPMEYAQALVKSMPRRIDQVLEVEGDVIMY